MKEPNSPEERASEPEARILWAASFLVDWIIPLLHENGIDDPGMIIELREKFDPTPGKGTDFTLNDVLVAANQWCSYINTLYPDMLITAVPSGKEYLRAIELITLAIGDPPKSEDWTQTSFLDE